MKLIKLVKEVIDYQKTKALAAKAVEKYQQGCSFELSRDDKNSFMDGFMAGYESAKRGE